MLYSLKIKNFRSIRGELLLDLSTSGRLKSELNNNILEQNGEQLISTAIIYGRNASGKSNILKAFRALEFLVKNSDQFKHDQKLPPYEPFIFERSHQKENIEFEIVFSGETGIKFNYKIAFNEKTIDYEALLFYPKGTPAKLFERKNKRVSYGDYYRGEKKSVEQNLLENQLFLSKTSNNNIPYLKEAYLFFTSGLTVSTFHDTEYDETLIRSFSEMMLADDVTKTNMKYLLCAADTNIKDFTISKNDGRKFKFPENMPKKIQDEIIDRFKYEVKTTHPLYENNAEVGEAYLDLDEESLGTKKLLAVGGLIISTLSSGGVIVVDELDKSLHPLLTRMLIKLFYSSKNNPRKAQLIFATHDSSLLDPELFRRDQIYFSDKEYEGNTILFRLSDLKGVRKDIPLDRWYLSGRFNAIPIIGDLDLVFSD